MCPKGHVLGHVTIRSGDLLHTCPHGRGGKHCGEKVFILAVSGGLCAVVRITPEEFEAIRTRDSSARDILRDLGALVEAVTHASEGTT